MDFTSQLLLKLVPGLAGAPAWVLISLGTVVPAILIVTFMALGPIVYVYAETKIAGFMQDRIGPKRVGPHGMLQTVADAVKLLFKEAIFPAGVDKVLFVLAPCIVNVGAFLPLVVVPFGSHLQTADLNVGVFYVTAVASLSTVGLIMAGWASNNKYALFGGMRSAAQIVPFDIPEAESELVAGFHTEYSGFFFAMFFMAEYTEMLVVSAVSSVLFLGGYLAPHPFFQSLAFVGLPSVGLGWFWLIAKSWFLMFVMMWLRWTLPRLRVDQLMYVAWKVLLPISFALMVVVGGLVMWKTTANGFPTDKYVGWPITIALFLLLFTGIVRAIQWSRRRLQEMAA